jgi:hypothetical protein
MACCAKCGFLTYKDHSTKTLEEATLESRRNGHFPADGPIVPSPRCFVLTFDLPLEVSEIAKHASDDDKKGTDIFLKVIQKERSCPTYCQWHQGSSPKEHKEIMFHIEMQRMQEEQRKADLLRQQEQRDKDFAREQQRLRDAERQRKEDLEWRAEQDRKTEERWQNENRSQSHSLIVIGVIGTIIIAAAQIAGSLIQAGWFK